MTEPGRANNPTIAAVVDAIRELERALAKFWVQMEAVEAVEQGEHEEQK